MAAAAHRGTPEAIHPAAGLTPDSRAGQVAAGPPLRCSRAERVARSPRRCSGAAAGVDPCHRQLVGGDEARPFTLHWIAVSFPKHVEVAGSMTRSRPNPLRLQPLITPLFGIAASVAVTTATAVIAPIAATAAPRRSIRPIARMRSGLIFHPGS